jgi:DNA-binding NtrC family response regulator
MGTLTLLLVDDEPDFLEPLAKRLQRRGCECATASSGEEALGLLAARTFQCAVVDVKMPGMSGLDLLRRARRDWPSMPVVLLTGHASVELGVQGMELGAFEYLLEPVELDDLLDTVRRAAEKASIGA